MYRSEATSPEGFVQQLAVSYLRHGYWFYVAGRVPDRKDPREVDRKLIERYEIDLSKYQRARRRKAGRASVQLLRHGHDFVLLATHGRHRFFDDEASVFRDARRSPVKFRGYSIGYRSGRSHVAIAPQRYAELKAFLVERAAQRRADWLLAAFRSVPFEPYAPVRRQLLNIWRAVNRRRREAGFESVPIEAVRMRRKQVLPFGPGAVAASKGQDISPVDTVERLRCDSR